MLQIPSGEASWDYETVGLATRAVSDLLTMDNSIESDVIAPEFRYSDYSLPIIENEKANHENQNEKPRAQ